MWRGAKGQVGPFQEEETARAWNRDGGAGMLKEQLGGRCGWGGDRIGSGMGIEGELWSGYTLQCLPGTHVCWVACAGNPKILETISGEARSTPAVDPEVLCSSTTSCVA